jgi:hypothetical protein
MTPPEALDRVFSRASAAEADRRFSILKRLPFQAVRKETVVVRVDLLGHGDLRLRSENR